MTLLGNQIHKTRETCGSIYDFGKGTKHIYTDNRNTRLSTICTLAILFVSSIQCTIHRSIFFVSLTVVHLSRRSRFFPSLLAVKDKSTSTSLTKSTSLLLSWFSREVFTCTHLEGIVVSYTFDFYLHNFLVPVSETVRYSWS